jgi:hypothetical protein
MAKSSTEWVAVVKEKPIREITTKIKSEEQKRT